MPTNCFCSLFSLMSTDLPSKLSWDWFEMFWFVEIAHPKFYFHSFVFDLFLCSLQWLLDFVISFFCCCRVKRPWVHKKICFDSFMIWRFYSQTYDYKTRWYLMQFFYCGYLMQFYDLMKRDPFGPLSYFSTSCCRNYCSSSQFISWTNRSILFRGISTIHVPNPNVYG
jgi:hypothetical protein